MKTKIYKVLSIMLTLAVILSTCLCAMGTISAAEVTYYVSATGDDDANTGEENSAFITVKKAVEKAVAENYGAGDTVTVKVSSTTTTPVLWGGDMPTHAFKLVLKSASDTQACISTGTSNNIHLGGDTDFENLVLAGSGGLKFCDFNVNFAENTKLSAWYNHIGGSNTATTSKQVINIDGLFTGYTLSFANLTGGNNYTAPVNIYINKFACPNVTYGSFNFGSNDASTTQYNSLINFKLNESNLIVFAKASKTDYTFGQNGAFQFINLTGIEYGIDDGELANIDDSKKWILSSDTKFKNSIGFTDVAGKYSVADGYSITATDGVNVISSQNGILDLTSLGAGSYEFTVDKLPEYVTYYVSAKSGSQFTGDGTISKPFKFICNAVTKAVEDGYTFTDVVTIKLMDEKTIQWGEDAKTPEHNFNLIVESYDKNNYSNVNLKQSTTLGGTTEFRYGIYSINDTYPQLRINNKDLIIGDSANFQCTYFTFGDNSTADTINGQNVVFKNSISSQHIYLSNILDSNGKKYSGDMNVTVDNPFASPILLLSGQKGTVYYKANVNLNIKQAKRISFGVFSVANNVCEGAIQLITNSKTSVNPDGIEFLKTTCAPAKGFYHLINDTNYTDLLEFTTTEGVYTVDTEKYDVTATDGQNVVKAKDGFLTLTAGTYTITATKIKEDTISVITEKLENEILNVWEHTNNEINIDNAESVATIDFGNKSYNNVRINVLNAKKITFSGMPVIKGSLHVAINGVTIVEGKDILDRITAKNGKWYIKNTSGSDIAFGSQDGEVLYSATGKELVAVNDTITVNPKFQNFLLIDGEYTIKVKDKTTNKYDKFIKYRGSNLANTYAKLKNGEKLNVVYYGGSVTNGSGATSSNVTSWRGLIGQWFDNTYPNVEINNVNAAIGATGSTFGAYRLNRYVIEQKPDLLFIEFSINDYYDLHFTDSDYVQRSAMQLETIIRNVRKELPNCDIIVLHTIEKNFINTARYGVLYKEAQAHFDIADHYDITTIDIGGALACAMPENWESVWSEYVIDDVHPTDKGYTIYADTIKEYLSNCLLHTEHTGKVIRHDMPEMVSNKLLDGDINYIDADLDLLKKSEALGGTGFKYNASGIYLNKDFGSITSTDGDKSVLAIEFTGTELTMAMSGSSHIGGFSIKIDNGQYSNIESVNVLPRIMVTGLTPGKHTIYIRPISSSSGTVLLNIMGFYTRDESKATKKCTTHKYGEYTSNNNATCVVDGTKTKVCEYCYKTYTVTEVGTKTEHTYEGESTICVYCGADKSLPMGNILLKDEITGVTYYYVDGLKSTTTGIVEYQGKKIYINKGRFLGATGLVTISGKKMYINKGYFTGASGIVTISGKKMYINKGYFTGASGIVTISGKKMYINKGYFTGASGIVTISGKKMYINKGYFTGASGIVTISGKKMYINKGYFTGASGLVTISGKKLYINKGYFLGKTGIVKIGSKRYYINKGYAQLSFSGKVKISGKTYTIKKGIVK